MNHQYRALSSENTIPNAAACIFMTGFCVGMVFFYLSDKAFAKETGIFDQTDILLLAGLDADREGMLGYVLSQRLRQLALLLLCAACRFRRLLLGAVVGLAGALLGNFLFTGAYRLGTAGVFLCLMLMFPHGICYLLLLGRLLRAGSMGDMSGYRRRRFLFGMREALLIFMLFALGILCEAYISPVLVQKIASLL